MSWVGVPLGTISTETDQISSSKNGFGNPYNNTGNQNTETEYTDFFWFSSGIIPIKTEKTENTELPYRKYRNSKILKLPKNNTENTNFKMTESKYTKITKKNYTYFDSIDNPILF